MHHLFRSSLYFIKEIKTIISVNKTTSMLSLLSLVMIFTILMLALTGGSITSRWIDLIKQEAEVSVYFDDMLPEYQVGLLEDQIKDIEGVELVVFVDENEAYSKMVTILGEEANVLAYFDDNPFSAYYELSIDFNLRDEIQQELESINDVAYIRDNRQVLDQLQSIGRFINWISSIVGAAVFISTFIITSHIIREGIHSNKEHIKTLIYLGAPSWFVNLPFVMEGVLLTGIAALIATGVNWLIVAQAEPYISGGFAFLPIVNIQGLIVALSGIVIGSAFALGAVASFFALKMVSE